ncbi:MAG TPA: hypothetical protein EYP85_02515 [Armatimonadetes bacterium]|nr:hypothetical protein [Armatimonadota bacterium]
MSEFKLVRLVRTPSSEVYLIWDEDTRVGQADIHYAEGLVHMTIVLEQTLSTEELDHLIAQFDEDVVSSYLPGCDRENFLVTVFLGEEVMSYSDTGFDDFDRDLNNLGSEN